MTEPSPIISAVGVRKTYDGEDALKGVDLAVNPGERVGLMGPSGCGKTTLLNCLGGVDRPDAGSIVIDGERLEDLDSAGIARLRREKIGTVFQFFHLLPTLTVAENIGLPLQLLNVAPAEIAERIASLVAAIGLEKRANALPSQLSGGEMQRVALARALAPRPRVIFADEPTGNLDSATGSVILDLIESLAGEHGTAILLVTHSKEATRICSRVVSMKDGEIIEERCAVL